MSDTPTVQPVNADVREALAEYAHEAWSGWMKYQFEKMHAVNHDGENTSLVMPSWAVDRWMRQMNTPYADLPEEEKANDREEADKMLAILQRAQPQVTVNADAEGWEPVEDGEKILESPDGSEDWHFRVSDDGDTIEQMSTWDKEWSEIGSLSFWGYRLCRRAPQLATQPTAMAMEQRIAELEAELVAVKKLERRWHSMVFDSGGGFEP